MVFIIDALDWHGGSKEHKGRKGRGNLLRQGSDCNATNKKSDIFLGHEGRDFFRCYVFFGKGFQKPPVSLTFVLFCTAVLPAVSGIRLKGQ
jgi:hypothetical protein